MMVMLMYVSYCGKRKKSFFQLMISKKSFERELTLNMIYQRMDLHGLMENGLKVPIPYKMQKICSEKTLDLRDSNCFFGFDNTLFRWMVVSKGIFMVTVIPRKLTTTWGYFKRQVKHRSRFVFFYWFWRIRGCNQI